MLSKDIDFGVMGKTQKSEGGIEDLNMV